MALGERWEERDGKRFQVKVLPEALPPSDRSHNSHYHFHEVGKAPVNLARKNLEWVRQHNLHCFSCNDAPEYGQIARKGINKRGIAWFVCVTCYAKHKEGQNR
ncbi:MAG: hypothetical protein M3R04_06535 [bacterium]|nr:hypothetical protein [bacterium]